MPAPTTQRPENDVTEVATDVRVVAPDEVRQFVAGRGGRLFVWISVHRGWLSTVALLEAETEPPASKHLYFRRIRADGFDLYLESRQRIWPRTLELALRRHRVRAYWNGLAWIT